MTIRIGYASINTQLPAPNRTVRLANATVQRITQLGRTNLEALANILRWNHIQRISLFRMSSDLIPLGSHPANIASWWEALAPELEQVGALIKANGTRVSMHPGQFTVLNSPRPEVVEASIRELEYHARIMKGLGLDAQHPLVIHLGGVYGDKAESMRRFAVSFQRLREHSLLGQAAAERIVLENDEKNYTIEDALALAEEIGTPVIFDVFHHRWNPAFQLLSVHQILQRAAATWSPGRGPQKIHYSDPWVGKPPGAHSQTVDLDAFQAFYTGVLLPFTLERDLDVMLEVKDKEQSVLKLYVRHPELIVSNRSMPAR